MLQELEAARALVDGGSRSRTQVAVIAEVARYEMLADRLKRRSSSAGRPSRSPRSSAWRISARTH